jgi:hypothetical protein
MSKFTTALAIVKCNADGTYSRPVATFEEGFEDEAKETCRHLNETVGEFFEVVFKIIEI